MARGKARHVLDAARNRNPRALEAAQRAFYYLGLGVTNLVNIVSPRLVLVGGVIMAAWPEGIWIVRNSVTRRARSVIVTSLSSKLAS